MATRTEQRRAAVWALYQSDLLGRPLEETSRETCTVSRGRSRPVTAPGGTRRVDFPLRDRLVAGPDRATGALDPAGGLPSPAPGELPGDRPVPPEVAIDEAVETAKQFCGADAPGFVNGILGTALRDRQAASGQ